MNSRRAFMLVTCLLLAVVLLVVVLGMLGSRGPQQEASASLRHHQQALSLAEAGLENVRSKLAKDVQFPPAASPEQMYTPFALTSQILPTLWAGGCLILQSDFDAGQVARAVREQGITRLTLYPAHYQALLEQDFPGERLRSCVVGAELCPQALHRAFQARFGLHIWQSMGMAETLAHSLNLSPRSDKKGSAGGRNYV